MYVYSIDYLEKLVAVFFYLELRFLSKKVLSADSP